MDEKNKKQPKPTPEGLESNEPDTPPTPPADPPPPPGDGQGEDQGGGTTQGPR
jgi:hypothetical protein